MKLDKLVALVISALVILSGCSMGAPAMYVGSSDSEGGESESSCATVAPASQAAGMGGSNENSSVGDIQIKEMIWDGMLARGFTPKEISAALANMQHESGFDATRAENGRGQYWLHPGYNSYASMTGSYIGWGLIQWTYGRHDAVRKYVEDTLGKAYYVSQYSSSSDLSNIKNNPEQLQKLINAQLDYLVQEFQGPYKSVMDAMASASTAEEASKVWTIKYEVPANKYGQANARAPLARQYYNQFSSRGEPAMAARQILLSGLSLSAEITGGAGFSTADGKKTDCRGQGLDASGSVTAQVDATLQDGGLYGKVCYNVCVSINGKTITIPHGVDDSGWSGSFAASLADATFSFPTEQRAFVAALAVSRTNMPYSFGGGHAIALDDKGFNKPTGGGLSVAGIAQCGPVNGGYDCSGLAGSAWYEAGGTAVGGAGWLPPAATMKFVSGANVRPISARSPGDALTSASHVAIYLGSYGGQEWLFHAQNCTTRISWTPYYDNSLGFTTAVGYDTNNGKVQSVGK